MKTNRRLCDKIKDWLSAFDAETGGLLRSASTNTATAAVSHRWIAWLGVIGSEQMKYAYNTLSLTDAIRLA